MDPGTQGLPASGGRRPGLFSNVCPGLQDLGLRILP